MVITNEQIEASKTPAGGWNRKQLNAWGVPWPPPKGWKGKLVAGESFAITKYCCRECKRLKSKSQFPKTQRRLGEPGLPCKACLRKIRKAKPIVAGKSLTQKSNPDKLKFAEQMRANMTPAERHLWLALSKLQPLFLPQVVLFGYIADFCCHRYKLVVEVDGSSHDDRKDYDLQRDQHLQQKRYRTLRFTNQQVIEQRASVLGRIIEAL